MSMATNLPILHYYNKYTRLKCGYIITGYFNQNSIFFPPVRLSYVQIALSLVLIGIFEKFFQILEAGFLLFHGCPYRNLTLGRDRGPWQ